MQKNIDYKEAREILLSRVAPKETTRLSESLNDDERKLRLLTAAEGRVLGEDVTAVCDVPPFDRSPYDGYAFRASDSAGASREHPVTLRVLEEIPAGSMWTCPVGPGTAAKILTGAPVPPGADAIVKYEDTSFTESTVTLCAAAAAGENVVPRGEDVEKGTRIAAAGTPIDPALAGTLAAQGIADPVVFARPRIGIVTTGSELAEPGEELTGGRIVNTNRDVLGACLLRNGCIPVTTGDAPRDDPDEIAAQIRLLIGTCDMVITTGGVSVGDYDYTPDAMERAGAEILIRTLRLKPGGASAYGICDGKLICGLSGNPASAMTNFYAVVLPVIRKLCGCREPHLAGLSVTLAEDFSKKSPKTRLIRGVLDLTDGTARMHVSHAQGNGVLHSLVGCDLLAEIPAGSGRLPAGTRLQAYRIP